MTNDNVEQRTLDQILGDAYHAVVSSNTSDLEKEFSERANDAGFLSQAQSRFASLGLLEERCAISRTQKQFLNKVLGGKNG